MKSVTLFLLLTGFYFVTNAQTSKSLNPVSKDSVFTGKEIVIKQSSIDSSKELKQFNSRLKLAPKPLAEGDSKKSDSPKPPQIILAKSKKD